MSSSLWPEWAFVCLSDDWRGLEIDNSPPLLAGEGRVGADPVEFHGAIGDNGVAVNLVDLAILVVIGLGVLIGWKNGLIGPLLAEGTFLLAYWVVSTHPSLVSIVPAGVPRPIATLLLPAALAIVVGFVGRMIFMSLFRLPFTRSVDKLLGAAANGALGFVIVYAVLLGVVGAGTVLDPLTKVASIRTSQVMAMQSLLAQNPQVAGFVPSSELGQLAAASSAHPVAFAQLGQYASVINYYENTLRPQLATSRLAPLVIQYGARLPIIGRHVTLPKA
jgi:uncharacterized membrane protein required for colicin V production